MRYCQCRKVSGSQSNMASMVRGSCGRLTRLRGVSRTLCKLYISTDVTKKDRILDRVKKFVFGEGPPPEEDETPESYFQFVKVEKPAVYSMKKKEIVDRLGNIITEVMPDNEKWRSQSIKDLVVKYKILNKCYEEFGILVPNFQLNEMKSVGDVIKFYTTAKPEDKRTFKSINKKKLPRNLSIGGSLPLKKVSVT